MEKKIETRIGVLEKELQSDGNLLSRLKREVDKVSTRIVSNRGAIEELRMLQKEVKDITGGEPTKK